MELAEAIRTRRSVRNYEDRPVSCEIIKMLLENAVQAPSAMNAQPWAFAIIEDKELLKCYSDRAKSLLLSAMSDYPQLEKYRGALSSPEFNIFYNAPTLIIIYAKPAGPHPATDCCLAAQNLMLAAHAVGLGTCWIGFAAPLLNLADVKNELGIPMQYDAVAPLILGYPADKGVYIPRQEPEILCWKK
ncbi:MAG: nitroreductase [Negativicutes bacterium]|nr:nitroreductase [Negativicutes bacterium]